VNLGSGTLDEALQWLEYCNGPSDKSQGRLRAVNGHKPPYGVKYWGIGNETWGPWETGHADADTYATSLTLWAHSMRNQDAAIKILGVGSEEGNDSEWDRTVLRRAGANIDFLTTHMYGVSTTYDGSEYEAFVFTPVYLENRLGKMADLIQTETTHPVQIAVDEWNIRHFFDGKQNRKSPRTQQDAIFAAGLFNAMVRLSPRVGMANYVFLANGNGTLLVRGDQIVWTPLAYTFQLYAQLIAGNAVSAHVDGPGVIPPPAVTGFPGRKPAADYAASYSPWIDAVAVRTTTGALNVALVNRHKTITGRVRIDALESSGASHTSLRAERMTQLASADIYSANTFESPDVVKPASYNLRALDNRQSSTAGFSRTENGVLCPPHSVTFVEFSIGNSAQRGPQPRD